MTRNRYLMPSAASTDALQRLLARAGWEIDYVDLDLTGELPKVELRLRRADGLWLWARSDALGRGSVERFHRVSFLGESRAYGPRAPRCHQHTDHFLGRERVPGPRAMLRYLTGYVVANALHPIALKEVRSASVAFMRTPARLCAPYASSISPPELEPPHS